VDDALSIRQFAPPLGRAPAGHELDEVLGLLGLHRTQMDPACPARLAGSASTRLLLGLRDRAALDAATPRLHALAALSPRIGAQGYFLFTRTGDAATYTESRMFCPALGIDEDPVSGNAHAMLGVYLNEHALLQGQRQRIGFAGAQGRHVGRPGRVDVEVELGADGRAIAASITGRAVIVFEAELRLA
jgi:PhzF family phenazine biosynthesis protein